MLASIDHHKRHVTSGWHGFRDWMDLLVVPQTMQQKHARGSEFWRHPDHGADAIAARDHETLLEAEVHTTGIHFEEVSGHQAVGWKRSAFLTSVVKLNIVHWPFLGRLDPRRWWCLKQQETQRKLIEIPVRVVCPVRPCEALRASMHS